MDAEHANQLIPDYVLGLLPAEERRRLENHARRCAACRLALQREQGLAALVRGAVYTAARPAPGRLAALRPAMPAPRPRPTPLYFRLAPLTLVAVLLAVGLLFGAGRLPIDPALFAADTPAVTATTTQTPTATLAAVAPAENPTATEALSTQISLSSAPAVYAPVAPPRAALQQLTSMQVASTQVASTQITSTPIVFAAP